MGPKKWEGRGEQQSWGECDEQVPSQTEGGRRGDEWSIESGGMNSFT